MELSLEKKSLDDEKIDDDKNSLYSENSDEEDNPNYTDDSDLDDNSDLDISIQQEVDSEDGVKDSSQKSKEKEIEKEMENPLNVLEKTLNNSTSNYNIDLDSDDDDSDDDNYLKKLENNRSFIEKNHKEINNINYNVIEKLCNVSRDENNVINDTYHTTLPILTKYEKTRIIGARTKQLNDGAKPFINLQEEIIDGEIIANMELREKKIPFIIKRPISNNKFEYWKLKDLEVI